MNRRAAVLVGVPLGLAVLVAVPLGLWRGSYQWLCAGIAVGLTVVPGLVTLIVAERMRNSAFGPVVALFLGTFVRLVVGFGGAVLVFLVSKPTFHTDPWSYWLWVLGMYLTTLVVETVLLGRQATASGAA